MNGNKFGSGPGDNRARRVNAGVPAPFLTLNYQLGHPPGTPQLRNRGTAPGNDLQQNHLLSSTPKHISNDERDKTLPHVSSASGFSADQTTIKFQDTIPGVSKLEGLMESVVDQTQRMNHRMARQEAEITRLNSVLQHSTVASPQGVGPHLVPTPSVNAFQPNLDTNIHERQAFLVQNPHTLLAGATARPPQITAPAFRPPNLHVPPPRTTTTEGTLTPRVQEPQFMTLGANAYRPGRQTFERPSVYAPPPPLPPPRITGTFPQEHQGVNATAVPSVNLVNQGLLAPGVQYPTLSEPYIHDPRRKLYDLPEFDGKPEEWPRFVAAFDESTRTFGYTNLENLFRLDKSLKRNARDIVAGLMIYPDDVPRVMEVLRFEYGRPELLVRSQMMQLRQVKTISEDDLRGFSAYAVKVRTMVGLFVTAGAEQHIVNPTLLEELVLKLPTSRRLEWGRYAYSLKRGLTLRDFNAWIDEAARSTTFVDTSIYSARPLKAQGKSLMFMTPDEKTVRFAETDDDSGCLTKPGCLICKTKQHLTSNCPQMQEMGIDDRWSWARKARVCFSCLDRGHQTKDCPKRKLCGQQGCDKPHNQLLHVVKEPREDTGPSRLLSLHHGKDDEDVLYRIIPVKLIGPNAEVESYALLDDASFTTLMEESLARELGLDGEDDDVQMRWYDSRVTSEQATIVNCGIRGVGQDCKVLKLRNVRAIRHLDLPLQTVEMSEMVTQHTKLKGIPIASYRNVRPRLLIGLNNTKVGSAHKTIECENGPVAISTPLGWILYGPTGHSIQGKRAIYPVMILHTSSFEEKQRCRFERLRQEVTNFFDMENFGILKTDDVLLSAADQRAWHLLKTTTSKVNDRFQTGLFWQDDEVQLPNNYQMALRRLENLQKKLFRNPELFAEYDDAILQYEVKGYARRLTEADVNVVSKRTWYLPHFGVENSYKKKLRIVFDAAAEFKGKSLNQTLLSGPDLNQPMSKILYQFREGAVAVAGDIREMFCQIRIIPSDRSAQRFLWRRAPGGSLIIYQMDSMFFGSASSPCSAQFVKNFNAEEAKEREPEAYKAITEFHYVDDYLKSFCTEDEAIRVSLAVKKIHMSGGFELRNFLSNSDTVRSNLSDPVEQATTNMNLEAGSSAEKILGMFWDIKTDEYFFDFKFQRVPDPVLQGQRPPTKREFLSLVMSIFDPYGFIAHVSITLKILLQRTWSLGTDWDDEIPTDMKDKLMEWLTSLKDLKYAYRIPRCYSVHLMSAREIQLHIFTDASEEGIAAVSYWRILTSGGVIVSFVNGKTRCAPRKIKSIPRLELLGALLGARMKESIIRQHSFKPQKTFLWTDAKTVLLWIQSTSRQYRPFVANKIAEILSVTEEGDWNWVPSALNPADDGTRIPEILHYDSNCRWLQGPEFLFDNSNLWSNMPDDLKQYEDEKEVRNSKPLLFLRTDKTHELRIQTLFEVFKVAPMHCVDVSGYQQLVTKKV